QAYHAPGDPNLSAEGGMTKIAVRAQFTPGTVTVTASAPGLASGSASFDVKAAVGPTFTGSSLTVAPAASAAALAIVSQPASQTVAIGQSGQFTVLVAGAGPVGFQWLKNGSPIDAATSYRYTTPATSSSDNGAAYSVIVTGAGTSTTSSVATLSVVQPSAPAITTQPQAQTAVAGQSAEFSVAASGSPVLSYQWKKNGADIPGATATVYDTPPLANTDDGSSYSVTVTNGAGTVTSAAA